MELFLIVMIISRVRNLTVKETTSGDRVNDSINSEIFSSLVQETFIPTTNLG